MRQFQSDQKARALRLTGFHLTDRAFRHAYCMRKCAGRETPARTQRAETLAEAVGHAGSIRARLRSVVLRAARKYATDFDRCVFLTPTRMRSFHTGTRARTGRSGSASPVRAHAAVSTVRNDAAGASSTLPRTRASGVRLHPGAVDGARLTHRACGTRRCPRSARQRSIRRPTRASPAAAATSPQTDSRRYRSHSRSLGRR